MVKFNFETVAAVSTALGTTLLGVTGLRMCTQCGRTRRCVSNSNGECCNNDCMVENCSMLSRCPAVDGWACSGIQLGLTGVIIGNLLTITSKLM